MNGFTTESVGARRRLALVLLAALTVVIALAGAGLHRAAIAQTGGPSLPTGQTHTLTREDNGTTLTVSVGDGVSLHLGTDQKWSTGTVSDPTVLRAVPAALALGVQGLWVAVAQGSSTVNSIGTVNCPPGQACPAIAFAFSATIVVTGGALPPPSPTNVTYGPGWNLLAAPNTALPVESYSWDPLAASYTLVAAGTSLNPGSGYWAYFSAYTTVTLLDSRPSAQITAPAGAWVMIGNPNALSQATVSGADAVYTYNAGAGRYERTNTLAPGAGAWARSNSGGTITISTAQ